MSSHGPVWSHHSRFLVVPKTPQIYTAWSRWGTNCCQGPFCISVALKLTRLWVFIISVVKMAYVYVELCCLHSVLWCCWLGGRKGIRPVKNWVVGCWHGYLSGSRCRLAYEPADATATHCLLKSRSRLVLLFWYWLTWVVRDKGVCVCVRACMCVCMMTPSSLASFKIQTGLAFLRV